MPLKNHAHSEIHFTDYLNRYIESRNRATVLSLINVISGNYVALMGLVIGLIADISLTWAFLFIEGLISLSAVFFGLRGSMLKSADS